MKKIFLLALCILAWMTIGSATGWAEAKPVNVTTLTAQNNQTEIVQYNPYTLTASGTYETGTGAPAGKILFSVRPADKSQSVEIGTAPLVGDATAWTATLPNTLFRGDAGQYVFTAVYVPADEDEYRAGTSGTVKDKTVRGVKTFEELKSALAKYDGVTEKRDINVENHIAFKDTIYIDANADYSLFGVGGPLTFSRGTTDKGVYVGPMLVVRAGSTLDVMNLVFDGKTATDESTHLLVWVSGTLIAKYTDFQNNQRRSPDTATGGAVEVSGSAAELLLSNCQFLNNRAPQGGALASSGGAELYISDSIFENNIAAKSNGGAIYASAGKCLIKNTEITENYAPTGLGGGVFLRGVTGGSGNGAGLYACTLSKNKAQNGGAVSVMGGGLGIGDGSTLSDNTVEGPYNVGGRGGGLFAQADGNDAPSIYIGTAVVSNNTAFWGGGGLWVQGTSGAKATLTLGGHAEIKNNAGSTAGTETMAGADGGGVELFDCHMTMKDSAAIRGNQARCKGAGVYAADSNLEMQDNARIEGNAIYEKGDSGGGAYLVRSTLAMADSARISGNSSVKGGGVFLEGGSPRLVMRDSAMISDNISTGNGGGCYASNNTDVTMIDSAKISGNRSGSEGGGLYVSYANISLSGDASIEGNTACIGGGFYLNAAGKTVRLSQDAAVQKNRAVEGTSSESGKGGGAYVIQGTIEMSGHAAIRDNSADVSAGGVRLSAFEKGRLKLLKSPQITGNTSGSGGKADNCYIARNTTNPNTTVLEVNGHLDVSASVGMTFSTGWKTDYRFATGIDGADAADALVFFYDGKTDSTGHWTSKGSGEGYYFKSGFGAQVLVYVNDVNPDGDAYWWGNLDNAFNSFVNGDSRPSNVNTFTLRALREQTLTQQYEIPSGATVTLTGATLKRGNASGYFRVQNGGKLILKGVSVDGKNIPSDYPLIQVEQGGVLEIADWGNVIGGKRNAGRDGGGIASWGTVTMTGGSVCYNHADDGGGIFNIGVLNVLGGTISENTADGDGGGVYNIGTLTLGRDSSAPIICENIAGGNGGGVWSDTKVTLRGDVRIYLNRAGPKDGSTGSGGGLFIQKGGLDILGKAYIHTNTAHIAGGGVYLASQSSGTMGKDAAIYYNQCETANSQGGGLYLGSGSLTVHGTIKENSAAQGAGVYTTGTLTLEGATIKGNKFTGSNSLGGGVYVHAGGTLVADAVNATIAGPTTRFADNIANKGGGLYMDESTTATFNMMSSFTGNAAQEYGGGAYLASGTLTLTQNPFSANTAKCGGGLYVESGTATLSSCRWTDNTASVNGGGAYLAGGDLTLTDYTKFEGNQAANGAGVYGNGGNLTIKKNAAITGNTSSGAGGVGAVYAGKGLTLGDDASILGNLAGSVKANLFLPANKMAALSIDSQSVGSNNVKAGLTLGSALPTGKDDSVAVASFDTNSAALYSAAGFSVDNPGASIYYFVKDAANGQVLLKKQGTPEPGTMVVAEIAGVPSFHETFKAAIAEINGRGAGSGTLTLLGNLPVTETAVINGSVVVNGAGFTLTRGAGVTGSLFQVTDGRSLALNNVSLQGVGAAALVTIAGNGALEGDGLKIQGNTSGSGLENNGKATLRNGSSITGNLVGVSGTGDLLIAGNVNITGNAGNNDVMTKIGDSMTTGQTIKILGALTGDVGVMPADTPPSTYPYTLAYGDYDVKTTPIVVRYAPTVSDAEHILWQGTADESARVVPDLHEGKPVIQRGKFVAEVDGAQCFQTLQDAFAFCDALRVHTVKLLANCTIETSILKVVENRRIVLTDGDEGYTVTCGANISSSSSMIQVLPQGELTVSGETKLIGKAGMGHPLVEVGDIYNTGVSGGKFILEGDAIITGAHTTAASGYYEGGGLLVLSGASATLRGNAQITGNTTKGGPGGGVYNAGNLTLAENASVTGNTADGVGADVYAGGTVNLSGKVSVGEVYLPNEKTLKLPAALQEGASIKVKTQTNPYAKTPVIVVAEGDAGYEAQISDAARFTSADPKPFYDATSRKIVRALTRNVAVTRGTGGGTYIVGADVMSVAEKPASGERFTGWTASGVTLPNPTDTVAAFVMPDRDVTLTANYVFDQPPVEPVVDYPVTVRGGSGSGRYKEGATVNIQADAPPEGMRFAGWTVNEGGVTLADASQEATTFAMPARAVDVSAAYEKIVVPVTKIEMIEARAMAAGERAYMAAVLTPSRASMADVRWSSEAPEVAAVDEKGLITALTPGETLVLAVSRSDETVRAACRVTVTEPETEQAINAVTLVKGKKLDLNKAIGKGYVWTSENPAIASVGKKGVLTGKKPGETVVRGVLGGAQAKSGVVGDEIQIRVTVVKKKSDVPASPALAISPSMRTQKVGERLPLTLTITPAGAGVPTWASADPAVATVDDQGMVTGVAVGETTITAKLGELSAACRVVVRAEGAPEEKIDLAVDLLAVAKGKTVKLNSLTGFLGTWRVEDERLATVSEDGVLKAVATGDTQLVFSVGQVLAKNATFMNKSLLDRDSVRIALSIVPKGMAVTKVKISGDKILGVGESQTLTGTVAPKKATYRQLFWMSSDESVATVDAAGVVTAIKVGSATITAISTSGVRASIKLTVSDHVTKLTMNVGKKTLKAGETLALSAASLPASLPAPNLRWKSSKPEVVEVDANGQVTARQKGKATITATTPDGVKASCKITVK